ncbi:hypothetical protein NXX23_15585 [Bacteroides ovatus]|nr:hypothetical protein [Bacteroides ovatus]
MKNAPLTKEEQTLIHQYETAFKAGVSFQQESELMALSAKYFKENDPIQMGVILQNKRTS